MNIVQIVSEAVPFCKTGGLADVAGALPLAIAEAGHNVSIVIPYYTAKISPKKHKLKNAGTKVKVVVGGKEAEGEIFTCRLAHNVTTYLILAARNYIKLLMAIMPTMPSALYSSRARRCS